jgi:chromosome segregation ATPase
MKTRIGMILAAFALAGCQDELERDEQGVIEAQEEVRKARTEGAREVGEAQREASKDVGEAQREAAKEVGEERQEAAEDVTEARKELNDELAELRKTLAEKRADPDLTAEERARLADYEQRYSLMETRVKSADERSDWSRMRVDMQQLGNEVESWGRD